MPQRKPRTVTRTELQAIQEAERCIRQAIVHLRVARTPATLKKIQSALNSVRGAERHAAANLPEQVWYEHRAKSEGWMIIAQSWTADGCPVLGRIMRWDATFPTNAAALKHVIAEARGGSEYHQKALELVNMALVYDKAG